MSIFNKIVDELEKNLYRVKDNRLEKLLEDNIKYLKQRIKKDENDELMIKRSLEKLINSKTNKTYWHELNFFRIRLMSFIKTHEELEELICSFLSALNNEE